jgi:radical SAM protein with 4Fe4S-binding SPASM domain
VDINDESVMALAEKICDAEVFSVVITGGEPLCRPDLVIRLIEMFKNRGIEVSLNTNLLLVSKDLIDNFARLELDSMLISCPSIDPRLYKEMTGIGNIQVFLQKLDILVGSGLNFFINMVVNRKNLSQIRSAGIELAKRGVRKFGATPMGLNSCNPDLGGFLSPKEINSIAEDLLWLEEQVGLKIDMFEAVPKCAFSPEIIRKSPSFLRRSCQAGKTVVSVSNTGDVRTCSHNNDVYGNLFMDDMSEIWDRMSAWRSTGFIPEECSKCHVVGKCLGGCRINARTFNKDITARDPWMTGPLLDKMGSYGHSRSLSNDSILSFPGKMRFRRERDDQYLVATIKGSKNASLVNSEMLNFLILFNKLQPISMLDLASQVGVCLPDKAFSDTIVALLNKRIMTMGGGECDGAQSQFS